MNRIQIYLEDLQLPIKSMFVGIVLIAVGSVLGNPLVNELFLMNAPLVMQISRILLFMGGLILSCFPYIVFVKLLYSRSNDKNIAIVGIVSYLVFLVMILFFSPRNLPESAYSKILKITIINDTYPLIKTGILGLIGIYYIVKSIYKKPARQRIGGFTKVFDPELARFIKSLFFSILFGIVFALVYPIFMEGIYGVIRFIAQDVNNPMSMFAYGSFERILSVLNLESILHNEMWFGSLGGTWNSLSNVTYIGDVNIWAAQLMDSIKVLGVGSAGRFSTVYYVLNLFAMPAYLTALLTTVSNKKDRRRGIITVVLGTLLSIFSGITLPLEIILLLTTPILYFSHLFLVGFMSAVLLGLGTTIGFSYLGVLSAATPGNILDLISLSRNNIINTQIITLLLFGVIVFVLYFYLTKFYYSKIAIDILNVGNQKEEVQGFIDRVGGIDNIVSISSTPTKINLALKDEDNINVGGLHRQGITKIVQTRQGYVLSYGAGSFMLQREVNILLKLHNDAKEQTDTHE